MELSTETVVNTLRIEYSEWVNQLTDEEKYAIRKYSLNSYDKIYGVNSFYSRLNSMLRGVTTDEKEMLTKYADTISNAILKHPIKHSVICYRGSNYDMTNNATVGQEILVFSFTSTSVIKSRKLRGKFEYIIHVPEGANAAYIEMLSKYPKQRELLLDKNTLFRVIARNGNLIELEVVT